MGLTAVGWFHALEWSATGGNHIPSSQKIKAPSRVLCALAGILTIVGIWIGTLVPALAAGLSDPIYAGLGGAYTAVVNGPTAGLYNPAGIIDSPGVHGAVGAFLSDAEGFIIGVSVATGDGPAVAWASDEEEIQGSFAFYVLPRFRIGLGISSYTGPDNDHGLSFVLGGQYYTPPIHFGISIRDLGAGIFGVAAPVSGHLSAALDALPGITIVGDIGLIPTGSDVAIGGEASFDYVNFRWGVAVRLSGGFIRAGLGVDGDLFGIRVELSGGLSGSEHHPFFSLGMQADIPAWW